jgi:hypothetical protein
MSAPTPTPKAADVPAQVFEQFLADLAKAEVPAEVVTRLHKTLIEDRLFTDAALKQAIFGEEPGA